MRFFIKHKHHSATIIAIEVYPNLHKTSVSRFTIVNVYIIWTNGSIESEFQFWNISLSSEPFIVTKIEFQSLYYLFFSHWTNFVVVEC